MLNSNIMQLMIQHAVTNQRLDGIEGSVRNRTSTTNVSRRERFAILPTFPLQTLEALKDFDKSLIQSEFL